MSKKSKRRQMMRAAAKAPNWIRHFAAHKGHEKEKLVAYANRKLGIYGPPAPVRHVDPATYVAEQRRKTDGQSEG